MVEVKLSERQAKRYLKENLAVQRMIEKKDGEFVLKFTDSNRFIQLTAEEAKGLKTLKDGQLCIYPVEDGSHVVDLKKTITDNEKMLKKLYYHVDVLECLSGMIFPMIVTEPALMLVNKAIKDNKEQLQIYEEISSSLHRKSALQRLANNLEKLETGLRARG